MKSSSEAKLVQLDDVAGGKLDQDRVLRGRQRGPLVEDHGPRLVTSIHVVNTDDGVIPIHWEMEMIKDIYRVHKIY